MYEKTKKTPTLPHLSYTPISAFCKCVGISVLLKAQLHLAQVAEETSTIKSISLMPKENKD